MKNFRYKGYFGRWFIPCLFILIVTVNLYFYFFKSSEAAGWMFFISLLIFLTFIAGLVEGHSMGRMGFIEDMEEDQDTRNTYLKRFIKKDE